MVDPPDSAARDDRAVDAAAFSASTWAPSAMQDTAGPSAPSRCAICASLAGLARAAENKRRGVEWNKDHPEDYDTRADDFSSLPALKTSKRATTRHFAELDDEDKPIRKWDVETTTTNYYLDQKG